MSSLPAKNKFLAIAVGKYTKVDINVFWLCPVLLDFFFILILFVFFYDTRILHCVKSVQIRSYFWSVFSYIQTKYEDMLRKSPYSVLIRKIQTRNNSVFGHILRSAQKVKQKEY